jgi:hypothetical protein
MQMFERYNAEWPDDADALKIEFHIIQQGGKYISGGKEVGLGLFHHYREATKLLWPDEYLNRWTDLILSEIINNTITVVTGPKDCGKTRTISKFALVDYWAFPETTLILISSTTLVAIETRVWGDIKMLFRSARLKHPWLSGNVLDSKKAISTDDLEDESDVRDMRKGLICVACKTSTGEFQSIAPYVGIKQKRRRHLGNEMQFMGPGMLESIGNMNSGDYKGIFDGNPIGQNDPLDKLAEPECGWESMPEPTKTTVWKNRRFLNSRTICLYGPDSPNFDKETKDKFSGMLNQDSIERVIAGYGKDSHQYYSQALGVRKSGLNAKRVISFQLCKQNKALEDVIWDGSPRVKIFGLDAAYGGAGGDRCVGGYGEFGRDVQGATILKYWKPVIVPIVVNIPKLPEDQIAEWVRNFCQSNGIPPENMFYDSTGRGSLGPSLARIWSANINPVEFGGSPSDRPVTMDHYIMDRNGQRRLKTCKEHYSKFVSELWWSTRYAIVAGQVRGLIEEVIDDGCMREWSEVAGNKIEIEPKMKMKERTGQSPDLYDWAAIVLEGARRRGFQIKKMVNLEEDSSNHEWITDLISKSRKLRESHELNYAA